MKPVRLLVTTKHFRRVAPARMTVNGLEPEQIVYDFDQDFIFSFDGETVRMSGSSWSKSATVDTVADVIKSYFSGTCYQLADIQKYLD